MPEPRYFVASGDYRVCNGDTKCWLGTELRSESGTIAPLIASYLALILLVILGSAAVVMALVAANRVQGVAEMAILFAHDRSVELGVPEPNELRYQSGNFLSVAPSAQKLELVQFDTRVLADRSTIRLCARYRNPLGVGIDSAIICREASAKSFLIESD